MKTIQKKLEKSQLEVEFELTAEEFEHHIEHALEHLKEHVKVDGFRKGNVPLKMVEEQVGTENLLMEAGDMAVKDSYYKFIEENKLEPIGEPEVSITKIPARHNVATLGGAKGEPAQSPSGNESGKSFAFKVIITVLPEIQLPDYKEIASHFKPKEISVSDSEVEDTLNYLQKSRAKFSQIDKEAGKKDFVEIEYKSEDINNGEAVKDRFILGEGGFMKGFEDGIVGMKASEEKDISVKFPPASNAERSSAGWDNATKKDLAGKDINFKVKVISVQKMELPEINDEFAKQLGGLDGLVALKNNIKEGLAEEKVSGEKQKQRVEILEKIAEKIDFVMPEKLVVSEQQRLLEDLKNRIEKMFKGSSFSAQGGPASGWEEYLASIKQTEEELKKTFIKEAEKRIKNFLVLREVGNKEGIEVKEEEIEEELNKNTKNYSKEQLEKVDIDQFREYSRDVIYNEKVFQLLESFAK